jgi:hypothetical protein
MNAYELKPRLTLTVRDEIGGHRDVDFAEAELTVKTWKSAPYGYGRDEWVPETVVVWVHMPTGTLTVDPESFVGGNVVETKRREA